MPTARTYISAWLGTWHMEERTYDAQVVATELVGNAVRHGQGRELTVQIASDGQTVTIRVGDESPEPPKLCEAERADESGRGLMIVAAYALKWGWEPGDNGKTVWAVM